MGTATMGESSQLGLRERIEEALKVLLPETLSTLGSLSDAPVAVAQAVMQLLPFGSRVALEDLEIVRPGSEVDNQGHAVLELTPFGFDVVDAAAKLGEEDPEGLQELVAEWDAAVTGRS